MNNHWLRVIREQKRISQERLAEKLGWSNCTISRLECGKRQSTVQDIKQIGQALGLTREEIASCFLSEAGLTGSSPRALKSKTREEQRAEIEVHVHGICLKKIRGATRILIAKRLRTRKLFPNKWECGGGQVRPGENFEEALINQMAEEFGIPVRILAIVCTHEVPAADLPQKKIPAIKFLCEALSETIEIDLKEFSDYRWVKPDDLDVIDFIEGINDDIKKGLELYKKFKISN